MYHNLLLVLLGKSNTIVPICRLSFLYFVVVVYNYSCCTSQNQGIQLQTWHTYTYNCTNYYRNLNFSKRSHMGMQFIVVCAKTSMLHCRMMCLCSTFTKIWGCPAVPTKINKYNILYRNYKYQLVPAMNISLHPYLKNGMHSVEENLLAHYYL